MGVVDYFRSLKAFIISFLFFFMNNILNKNETVLEETLADSNSDAVKTTFRGLRYFKMALPVPFVIPYIQ